RVGQHPGQRDVRRLLAELGAEALERVDLRAVARNHVLRPLALPAPGAPVPAVPALALRAAQRPAAERAVRDQPQAVRGAGGRNLELHRALDQAVLALLADQAQEVAARRRLAGPGDVPPREVRRADVDDLPLLDQQLHRLPDL